MGEVKPRRNKRSQSPLKIQNLNDTLSGHVFHESDHAKLDGSFRCGVNTVLEAFKVGDCFYKVGLNHFNTLNLISK